MRFRIPFLFACFALGAFLVAATPASAAGACGGPCQQVPPVGDGGGGGYTCITDCKACATETTENGNSYSYCVDATSGSCGCVFSGPSAQYCGGTGSCTYE